MEKKLNGKALVLVAHPDIVASVANKTLAAAARSVPEVEVINLYDFSGRSFDMDFFAKKDY